jgi:hypothetical protein
MILESDCPALITQFPGQTDVSFAVISAPAERRSQDWGGGMNGIVVARHTRENPIEGLGLACALTSLTFDS